MKRWMAWIVLVLVVGIQSVLAAKSQNVTLVVDDVPVVQVLQALAEQEKKNLVVSPDVSGVLSLHLTDVPRKRALQTVVKSAGLVLRQKATFCMCILFNGRVKMRLVRTMSRHGFRPACRWNIAVSFCNMLMPPSWQKPEKSCSALKEA